MWARASMKLNGKTALDLLNRLFGWAERRGFAPAREVFVEDYSDYPAFRSLEEAWPEIREECEALMGLRAGITDMSVLGGNYTAGGVHLIGWKTFVLVAGGPIEENAALCPRTAAHLAEIPEVCLAFFSILEPHQHIKPHWGYYKGILRYHLGVIIPGGNREGRCWIRVNNSPRDNVPRDKALIERGARYFWKPGKGVFFDDTWLHDAANEADEPRVVLFIDVRRRFPWWLDWVNRACLAIVLRSSFIRKVRERARFDPARSHLEDSRRSAAAAIFENAQ
jgi:beta-hydroxylase